MSVKDWDHVSYFFFFFISPNQQFDFFAHMYKKKEKENLSAVGGRFTVEYLKIEGGLIREWYLQSIYLGQRIGIGIW